MAKNITFKKDSDKQRIDELLADNRIRSLMPDKVKGKCAPMVLWSIEFLVKVINGDYDNLQSKFRAEGSKEIKVMTLEKQHLKVEFDRLQKRVVTLEKQNQELKDLADGYVETINGFFRKS